LGQRRRNRNTENRTERRIRGLILYRQALARVDTKWRRYWLLDWMIKALLTLELKVRATSASNGTNAPIDVLSSVVSKSRIAG
jgi:hypothetical protein